jgi:hypothetical protein
MPTCQQQPTEASIIHKAGTSTVHLCLALLVARCQHVPWLHPNMEAGQLPGVAAQHHQGHGTRGQGTQVPCSKMQHAHEAQKAAPAQSATPADQHTCLPCLPLPWQHT